MTTLNVSSFRLLRRLCKMYGLPCLMQFLFHHKCILTSKCDPPLAEPLVDRQTDRRLKKA